MTDATQGGGMLAGRVDAWMGWANKEMFSANLAHEIDYADKQISRYGRSDAFLDFAGPGPRSPDKLRWVWVKLALEDILRRLRASKFDFVPDLGREAMGVHGGAGFGAWLKRHDLEEATKLERDVLDAVRAMDTLHVGEVNNADGTRLLAWRALSPAEKSVAVARWHQRAQVGIGVYPRQLARDATWPTSTFDPVPWACGHVLHDLDGKFLASCDEPRDHLAMHSDMGGDRRWDVDRLREPTGHAFLAFAGHVEECDREITKAILGEEMTRTDRCIHYAACHHGEHDSCCPMFRLRPTYVHPVTGRLVTKDEMVAEINGDVGGVVATSGMEPNADAPLDKLRRAATAEMNRQMVKPGARLEALLGSGVVLPGVPDAPMLGVMVDIDFGKRK